MPNSNLFPLLYHAHHSLHNEDLPFWHELAAAHPGPILEMGCGTGRVLVSLIRAGYAVIGLDKDRGMLEILQRNLTSEERAAACVVQADITHFRFAAQFGLILIPCNTFSTLTSPDRRALLKCAVRHLHPAGIFATSLPNPFLLKHLPTHAETEIEEVFSHPLDGEPVQVSSAWKRRGQAITIYWHYDHLLPDGSVERLTARVQQCLTSVAAYLEEMREVGFHVLQTYGDFDRSNFTSDSSHLIILASR